MSPPTYRNLLDLATRRAKWVCADCARPAATLDHNVYRSQRSILRRALQTSRNTRQSGGSEVGNANSNSAGTGNGNGSGTAGGPVPTMQQMRRPFEKKNQNTIYYTLSIILGTLALSYGSVPLYKTICQQTGWGGQPIKSAAHSSPDDGDAVAAKLTPVTSSRRLRITFAGSTSDILPWKFTPQQREVRVLPGETALAFYTATNQSKEEDIIGVATYSVTPAQVAPYFSKIQCFCFEEQRLNKGETVDMPVFFYIDPDFLRDPNMKGIDTITLNYTFFKAKYDKNGHLTPMPMPY